LGVIFSSLLYGIMLTQTHKYYQRFKKDPLLIKLLVFVVLILNTFSLVFVRHASWYYLVTTGPRIRSVWSLNVEFALSMFMSAISEIFLTCRVYKLSRKNIWLTAPLLSVALLHFVSGEVAAIELMLLGKSATVLSAKVPSILRLSSAAVCDTAIAASLTYILHSKRTGFKRNDKIINHLILFSINSGVFTSAISIASLITYVTIPKTWVYTALCFLISRLYATSFLCSLNSRQILFDDGDSENEKAPAKMNPAFRAKWSVRRSSSPEKTPTQIFVVTETITDGPQALTSAKIRNPDSHLKEIMENASDTSLSGSSSPSGSSYH